MSESCPLGSERMDVVGHLEELRRRILACLAFFLVVSAFLFSQGKALLSFLQEPARGLIREFVALAPTEVFATYFKVVVLASLAACFPFVLYELWAFVAPAVPGPARRRTAMWFALALASFFGGLAFSYHILLPAALKFLFSFGRGLAEPTISLAQYVSFAAALLFASGLVFEIPVVMGLLAQTGLIDVGLLRSGRRYAVLVIFIVAAIVTPTPDAFNLCLLALPMVILYEAGIRIAGWVGRHRAQ